MSEYTVKNGLRYQRNGDNPYYTLVGVDTDISVAIIDENCKVIGEKAFYKCFLALNQL